LDNQVKTNWNITKHETGKLHLTEQIPSLTNDEKVKEPELLMLSILFSCKLLKI
jgi:hypothetical protein